jgi:hypothetical protein
MMPKFPELSADLFSFMEATSKDSCSD